MNRRLPFFSLYPIRPHLWEVQGYGYFFVVMKILDFRSIYTF